MTKKLIFIIGTLSNGGAERVVSNITLNLPENIEKEIILFGNNAKVEYDYSGNIIYLDNMELSNTFFKIIAFIKRTIQLRKIKRKNPDAHIISFLEYPNLLNLLSGNYKQSIVSVRNFMSRKHHKGIKALFWNITIKYLYARARKIIAVSEGIKKDLIENYNLSKKKIEVIYNPYQIKEIEWLKNEKFSVEDQKIFNKPTIITAGRLHKQKGHKHLIESFKIVKQTISNAQLVILGEGELESSLKEQAEKLNIKDSVHFLGFKENPFKYIARSKVFVMTSYYEGFPNALAEAMACGVPVISTDCPSGPREILAPREMEKDINYDSSQSRHGILVPTINEYNKTRVENKIASHIVDLIKDEELHREFSSKSYNRILDFDINKIIKEWEKIIDVKKSITLY